MLPDNSLLTGTLSPSVAVVSSGTEGGVDSSVSWLSFSSALADAPGDTTGKLEADAMSVSPPTSPLVTRTTGLGESWTSAFGESRAGFSAYVATGGALGLLGRSGCFAGPGTAESGGVRPGAEEVLSLSLLSRD